MASQIHTITLPVRGDGKDVIALAHAAALAKKSGAHVKVVHCHPVPDDMMPYGVVIPRMLRAQIESAIENSAGVEQEKVHQEFRELAGALGLLEQEREPGKATASFVEYEGKAIDAVRHHGRLADLICVPQPDREQNLGANTLKAALFSSGRPVMICPPRDDVPETIGTHVAIGWNGSLEASRAVRMAMPLIEAAEKVTILSAGDSAHTATPEELQEYLSHRGIPAGIERFDPKGVVGAQLLRKCEEIQADMLVMGAYHDSYERETVFGGNSQAVVDTARLPVVMAH